MKFQSVIVQTFLGIKGLLKLFFAGINLIIQRRGNLICTIAVICCSCTSLSDLFYGLHICNDKIYGIDLSHHNQAIEWDKVTASFVYLKATEGDNYVDPTYKERVVECRDRSILVGAYHYLTTSSDPKDQFDNF